MKREELDDINRGRDNLWDATDADGEDGGTVLPQMYS